MEVRLGFVSQSVGNTPVIMVLAGGVSAKASPPVFIKK